VFLTGSLEFVRQYVEEMSENAEKSPVFVIGCIGTEAPLQHKGERAVPVPRFYGRLLFARHGAFHLFYDTLCDSAANAAGFAGCDISIIAGIEVDAVFAGNFLLQARYGLLVL
jgi:hypothetical protein